MKNVLILVDAKRGSGRQFLTGVGRYAANFADWQIILSPPDYLIEKPEQSDAWYRLKEIDGIIARDITKIHVEKVLKIKKPKIINDAYRQQFSDCSVVTADAQAIGKAAAEYFLGLGFELFAYCGLSGFAWSQKRCAGYKKTLKDSDISNVYEYQEHISQKPKSLTERVKKMAQWLRQLPRPVCVFACNDEWAACVLDASRTAGLSVPEEISVLGVDNDELVCNFSSPSLSSIQLDFENAGFLAAQHLNDLMNGKNERKVITVPYVKIVDRHSTEVLAIEDQDVISALLFIRKNYLKPIQAMDVVNVTYLSRRELERKFKKVLKRTIKGEIERLRIELIKNRLLNSTQPAYQIAAELEFIDPEHFPRYFKNATGQTPSAFRRKS